MPPSSSKSHSSLSSFFNSYSTTLPVIRDTTTSERKIGRGNFIGRSGKYNNNNFIFTIILYISTILFLQNMVLNIRAFSFSPQKMRQITHHSIGITSTSLKRATTCCSNTRLFSTQQQQQHPNDSTTSTDVLEQKQKLLRKSTRLSLAPMMEYTDRHFRYLIRLLSKNTLVYSEMVTANAIAHEYADLLAIEEKGGEGQSSSSHKNYHRYPFEVDKWQLRRYLSQASPHLFTQDDEDDNDDFTTTLKNNFENPAVLQLGGSCPDQLSKAIEALVSITPEHCDYTALNLNCGCPSPKVAGKGCFGAALMTDPKLVRDCTQSMFEATQKKIPVTVKCRIGTDLMWPSSTTTSSSTMNLKTYKELDKNDPFQEWEYQKLCEFIDTISSNQVVTDFQIHARSAILNKKFSPADNRKIPPLKYDFVYRLTRDFPDLTFSLNGGVETLWEVQNCFEECAKETGELAGVMIGRAFAANPWGFAVADSLLWGDDDNDHNDDQLLLTRWKVLQQYAKHADYEEALWGTKIRRFILKAIQGLFMGEPNAKKFRIELDRVGGLPKTNPDDKTPLSEYILNAAQTYLSQEVLYRTPMESYQMALEMEERRKQREEEEKIKLLSLSSSSVVSSSSSSDSSISGDSNNNDDEKSQISKEWQRRREDDKEELEKAKADGEDMSLMNTYESMLKNESA